MKGPKYATSKVRLARALNLGRNKVHELSQEVDFPRESSHGWNIEGVRKWMEAHKINGNGSEREAVQVELLKAKLEREKHDLAESRNTTRRKIVDEMLVAVNVCVAMMRAELYQMRYQLAPRFEGLSAREIFAVWEKREREMYSRVYNELRKRTGVDVNEEDTRQKANVVAFDWPNGNGAKVSPPIPNRRVATG
jgi:hypothetical protein